MTDAEARQILNAIGVLERIKDPTPAEKQALERARGKMQEATGEVGKTRAIGRGVKSGVTFGLNDEVGALIQGGDYSENLEAIRASDDALRAAYPESFRAGEFAGGGMTAALPLGVTARALTTGGKMLYGALTGGLTGGAHGFGDGRGGFGPRLNNAKTGAAIGAGAGFVAPGVARGVGAIGGQARTVGQGVAGVAPRAARPIADAAGNSQRSGTDIAAYLDNLGPEATLADVPGNLRASAQGLAVVGGEGSELLQRTLRERAGGAGGRIEADMTAALGGADDAAASRVAQATRRTQEVSPLYNAAKDYPEPISLVGVKDHIERTGKNAVGRTKSALDNVYAQLGLDADNPVANAELLHNVRSDLSDAVFEARGTKFAVGMEDTLKEIDAALDQVPGYAKARANWADSKAIDAATDAGRKALSGGAETAMSPAQLRFTLDGMKPAEREAFRKGAREWIAAKMGTARNDAATVWGELGKNWNEEKLKILLGDEAAATLLRRVNAEREFSRTFGDVSAGSQTEFRRQAGEAFADLADPATGRRPGPVAKAREAFDDTSNSLIDELFGGTQNRTRANRDAGMLLSLQGEERDKALQELLRLEMLRNSPARGWNRAGGMLSSLGQGVALGSAASQ